MIPKIIRENKIFIIGLIFSLVILLLVPIQTKIPVGTNKPKLEIDPSIKSTLSRDIANYKLSSITCFPTVDHTDRFINIVGFRITSNRILEIYLENGEMYAYSFTVCKFNYLANLHPTI